MWFLVSVQFMLSDNSPAPSLGKAKGKMNRLLGVTKGGGDRIRFLTSLITSEKYLLTLPGSWVFCFVVFSTHAKRGLMNEWLLGLPAFF